MVISFIKFILFLLFFIYFPTKIILRLLKINIGDKLTEIGFIMTLGIVLITILSLLIRMTGLNFLVLWVIFAFPFLLILKFGQKVHTAKLGGHILQKHSFIILLIILLGIITQNLALFRGGLETSNGYLFPFMHDAMWNIALSAELFGHFPPENPSMSGVILKNNHYFYPLFLAVVRYITGINVFDLYFRLGPLLMSALFGLGLYSVSGIFTKNIFFRGLCVFLGYFSGNFSYLLPLFLGAGVDWKGNSFFADQPFDQINNPYSIMGFIIMLFSIYSVSKIFQKAKFNLGYSLSGGILIGALYGFKSFGGVAIIISLILTFLMQFIIFKEKSLLIITFISSIVFGSVFFFTTDPGSASLIWIPGWLLTQLVTDKDKVYLPHLADKEIFYQSIGNHIGILKIKFIEFCIYFFGNLGTRIMGVFYLIDVFFRKRTFRQKYITLFICTIILVSFSIPLLFNLRNSTFNIIQFTPYSLLLLAVLSGVALEGVYLYFLSINKKKAAILLILVYLILSLPVNVKNIADKMNSPKDIVTHKEMEALTFLKFKAMPEDIILIDPRQFENDAIYIPAISEHRVFLSSSGFAVQTGLLPQRRTREINEFFSTGDSDFLKINKISYIYLLKTGIYNQVSGMLEKINARVVFDNNQVIIWQIVS